jgi:hypothetical protein
MPTWLAIRDHVVLGYAGELLALPASMKCTWLICLVAACYSNHAIPDGALDGAYIDGTDAPSAMTIVHSFDGQIGAGLTACTAMGGHCDRPEMNAAANGSQVVQVSSIGVSVYSYTGTLLATTPLPMFITNAGLQTTGPKAIEPHVVYDEFIQRWVITVSAAFDGLLVSASSDATGAWAGVYIDNDPNDPSIHLGYDINGVYLSEVQAGTNPDAGFNGVAGVYFAIPSSEMKWVGTFAPAHKNRAANMPIDGMPAIDQSLTKQSTDHAFFVTKSCNGNCQNASAYSFHWIVNTVTWSGTTATYGADQIIKTAVGSTQDQWLYNTPIAAVPQAGSTTPIRPTEGHRVMTVAQTGSHLYTTLGSGPCTTTTCGAQGNDTNDLFFWVDLDCSAAACVVAQTGKVSDPNDHLVFATIGATLNGNLGIVAASVGAAIDPSILMWTHATTDVPSTLNGPSMVMAGTQPDTCIASPISFASAVGISTVRDPLDPTKLWTTHQYSNSASPCVWATRVIELAP